jgi:hypothetical protein
LDADPISPEVLDNLPYYEEEALTPPPNIVDGFYQRKTVNSAHLIDLEKKSISVLDSVAISPHGNVVHGRYGDLGEAAAQTIPLEYLALLRPASEGAAALRMTLAKSKVAKEGKKGTLLVYGASQASGLSLVQLASASGHAVVAVVDSQHSGNDDFFEVLKGMVPEPGAVVPEEYAISKKKFEELVSSVCTGEDGLKSNKTTGADYLKDFKANLLDYVEAYPDTRPAAVSQEHLDFKYMEKDREMFGLNMEAFLEQYPPGSPPIDPAKLDAFFTLEQYQIFRDKFWKQTTDVISGDDTPFSAPHLAKRLSEAPETVPNKSTYPGAGPEIPYSFSVTNPGAVPPGTEASPGGPVLGAVIVATPLLEGAMKRVAEATKVRSMAEALQFMSASEKAAFRAAASVASRARAAGAPVLSLGGQAPMAGVDPVGEAIFEDVQTALAAMEVDADGKTKLNYFVQVYRANDFPYYADYAVERATEPLAGPRQVVVTK